MARTRLLHLFAGCRFLVAVFDRGGKLLQSSVPAASLKSLPGGILKIAAAHEVGRDALVVPFAPGSRAEVWFFRGSPREPDTYMGRRIVVSYEGVEPLPIDLDAGESGVALDAVALTGVSYDAFDDVPQDQWPEWMPQELRTPTPPSVELPRA